MPKQSAPVKESFEMLYAWEYAINGLSDEDAGRLLKAMYMYSTEGCIPVHVLPCHLAVMFSLMKPVFDGKLVCANDSGEEDA